MAMMTDTIPSLPERLRARAAASPDGIAYRYRAGSDDWRSVTWREVALRVDALARQLARLGLRAGDRVAIMLAPSPEWEYCQFAVLTLGGVVVGIDAHDAPRNLKHILSLTQPRLLVTADDEKLRMLGALWHPPEIAITCAPNGPGGSHALRDLLTAPDASSEALPPPAPEDAATIVFTSGSTGQPKGIAYSHRQVTYACDAILERFPSLRPDARLACWLPLSNLFQRMINFCALTRGTTSYFVDDPAQIVGLLPQVQPTLFIGVPRFFEKLHAGILTEIAKRPAAVRALVLSAWAVGCRIAAARRAGRPPALAWRALQPLAAPVLHRLRAIVGEELQFMVSGSAPMPTWLLERLHGLGWLVLEAYGISENVIPVAANTPEHYRFGSVGRALPDNELRIAEDGELLVRGPGVFSGYYGEGTPAGPLGPDGFLHTGDFARIDGDGYVWLEGRKSEVFKTSTGRRVAPAPIEAALKQIDYVDDAVIIGRDRPYPVAILVLDPVHPVTGATRSEAAATIAADVAAACETFSDYQRPGVVILSPQPFTIAAGELTANLKIRRTPIESRFRAQIEAAYAHPAPRKPAGPFRPRIIHTQ
ncbi:AMP-dependent synthetase/ligase [Aromatoleum sp.]|uniref:AMP-dependent synthetase/ligase n=1 Tax=Aromatoleum sp. TaxID=2307007 RepID=UPI002FC7511C